MKELITMAMRWVDSEENLDFKAGKMLTFAFISFFVLLFGMISIGIIVGGVVDIAQAISGYHPK